MPVVTQYVVVRDGEEKMTFNSKAEADAHDKMLDMVDELVPLLKRSDTIDDEQKLEDLAFFLAREREQVVIALGATGSRHRQLSQLSPTLRTRRS